MFSPENYYLVLYKICLARALKAGLAEYFPPCFADYRDFFFRKISDLRSSLCRSARTGKPKSGCDEKRTRRRFCELCIRHPSLKLRELRSGTVSAVVLLVVVTVGKAETSDRANNSRVKRVLVGNFIITKGLKVFI